jgi:hypothetical protein
MADTTYIVLHLIDHEGTWKIEDLGNGNEIAASNAADAIRKSEPSAGTYVAVPARSWKPVTVTTDTKSVLNLEQPAEPS